MKRIYVIISIFALISAALIVRLIGLINDDEITAVSAGKGTYTVKSVVGYGGIYDCNMLPLVNCTEKYDAVVIPNSSGAVRIQPYLLGWDAYYSGISGTRPFLCEVSPAAYALGDETVIFRSLVRTDSRQLAPHIVGYTSDNVGMYGLEKAFDEYLRGSFSVNSATFGVDALGGVLGGVDSSIVPEEPVKSGIVTTIDKNIQQICETAVTDFEIKKGAIIVMDVKSGDIKAVVSCPDFDPTDIAASLNDGNSPFVNRAFSAYSVGSIFKLVTAAAALEQGISPEYSNLCVGSIDINGQVFNCHKWGGHGEINMREAMVQSCNPYFIALSQYLDGERYVQTAADLGFGESFEFCPGMVSSAGNLQTPREIAVAAERANMSFGQGMLTATPLQICRMTAAIANGGVISTPRLINGFLDENGEIEYAPIAAGERAISYETAKTLKGFMVRTVRAENSMSKPDKTAAGGKTSTAQTGTFDENGNEIMNCWFTGYFPSYNPKYAVTVLIEGGKSGNSVSGPVFRQIADNITIYERTVGGNSR
ncbi:MAG: penicillin-binding protein 2 [Ruminococcus sp.]|nr:penicillin-binding protein 2 [Ruminococcus sp.]MCM1382564.1 penicillin-binding protein 2 [Muribaculaceae bacterium]